MLSYPKQLRDAGVPCFPCWTRYNSTKGRYDKGPAVPKGESWQATAYRPLDDAMLNWSSGVVGVPVPPGVVVFDLDTYKGVTREQVDAWLGTSLEWDRAALQRTIGGGEHYAFRCDWNVKQGDSIGVTGFDTRSAGRGFICSGNGYTPLGLGGVLALGVPHLLPVLPDSVRGLLERPATPAQTKESAPATGDGEDIIKALQHIDPGCSRAEWVRVGMALRHQFQDEEETGLDLFARWSAGEFWRDGTPANYVSEHIDGQWSSFKVEGGVTIASVFYQAIQGGWQPSAFDTSAAFATQADATNFNELVEQIREKGCDVKNTNVLIDSIKKTNCSPLQLALLAAELKTELAHAGVKDRRVTGHIDSVLAPPPIPKLQGAYGKCDPENAQLFLSKFYSDKTLVRCDGEFYGYDGKIWSRLTSDLVKHQVATDMSTQLVQENRISACFRMVTNLSPVFDGHLNKTAVNLVVFNNGILNVDTGELRPHDKSVFTTNILPYAWDPAATCPQWLHFLNDIFESDVERIALLQEWIGYLLTRDYSHHKIMFLLGGGRSGKGTVGRVIRCVIGAQNYSGGSLSSLASDSFLDGISEKTAVFIGDAAKRVAPRIVNEVIERFKTISGNDEVSWHRMYHGAVSRTLATRFTMAANNIPAFFDDSGALASRLLLLTFDKSYLGCEDLTLGDRLVSEASGIAAWALEGRKRLQQHGHFTEPAASREEMEYIRENYSPLTRFIREECVVQPSLSILSQDLYNTYRAWCVNEGEDLMKQKSFISAFKDATRGKGPRYGTHRTENGIFRGFKGLTVRGEIPANAAAFKPQLVK